MRNRVVLASAAVLIVTAGFGGYWLRYHWDGTIPLPRSGPACTVAAPSEQTPAVALEPEQMANAATIAAIGIRRKVPERGVVVALATALQESKLHNLAGGDRDSVGLFQQRPSQGWGTEEQISDPRYAAKRFYAALTKVDGWEQLSITEAAQQVQRSAYPEAYEKWADEAQVLAAALLGRATEAVACAIGDEPAVRGDAAAAALGDGLRQDWGKLKAASSTELMGLTLTVGNDTSGWQYAHWLVAHAADRGVKRVGFGDREWTARDGEWSTVGKSKAVAAGQVVAEVFGNV